MDFCTLPTLKSQLSAKIDPDFSSLNNCFISRKAKLVKFFLHKSLPLELNF